MVLKLQVLLLFWVTQVLFNYYTKVTAYHVTAVGVIKHFNNLVPVKKNKKQNTYYSHEKGQHTSKIWGFLCSFILKHMLDFT